MRYGLTCVDDVPVIDHHVMLRPTGPMCRTRNMGSSIEGYLGEVGRAVSVAQIPLQADTD